MYSVISDIIKSNSSNPWSLEEIILQEIVDFEGSRERQWMLVGDRYYKVENDVLDRQMIRHTEHGDIEDPTKANNKLAHASVKNLIDEKIGYLLTKEYSLETDNQAYLEKIKNVLGKYFQYTLSGLGYEASNKGKGWLQVYINEQGKFKAMIIPAEQCVPIWTDNSHTELQAMIRFYVQEVFEGKVRRYITKIEYYTSADISFYVIDGDAVIPDVEVNEGGPIPHYKKGEEGKSWGKVPFIAFKNNRIEYPDIRYIKSLADNYDFSRSDVANFIEEVKNLIYVLRGYGGQDLKEFMDDLNYYKAIKIDDPQDGGVDTLNPTIDINAAKEHFEQLKRDINEFGQGVTKDLDKFGSAPSGVALKFLYAGLDLKCNHLEVEFKQAFEQLLYFVNSYLSEAGQGIFQDVDVQLIFNRDIQINETEAITNCMNSESIISDETIIANHPWTTDAQDELKKVKAEKAQKLKEQQASFGMPVNSEGAGDDEGSNE
ncbi:MAG: phage portal protein [Dehalobacter sp.]|nr:phage portal protein [Dehalobacter sp.]